MNISVEFEAHTKSALIQAMQNAPYKTVRGLQDWVQRSSMRVVRVEKQEVPVDKGMLQNAIFATSSFGGLKSEVKPIKKYAYYVHEGTGIYGPNKRPIIPKSKSFLAWETSDGWHYARSVKGMKPNPFVKRTYTKVKPDIERDASLTLKKIVESI